MTCAPMHSCPFPKNFHWGVATSAYQIEGAAEEDGRGPSIWDWYCRQPGAVAENHTGNVACDHYHRISEDIKRIKALGVDCYRFSIAWPRVLPEGTGTVNRKGLDFYQRLVDQLLANDLTPFVTLFHWDLPLVFQEKFRGWASREIIEPFVDYSRVVVEALSDRVEYWVTLNETLSFTHEAWEGRPVRAHAPGNFTWEESLQSVHNALVAHGHAVNAIRDCAKTTPQIGIVDSLPSPWPAYQHPEHIKAAQRAWYDDNHLVMVPLMTGTYDESVYRERQRGFFPEVDEGDMDVLSSSLDFVGLNYYSSKAVVAADNSKGYEHVTFQPGYPQNTLQWEITPFGIYTALTYFRHHFGDLPVYITENGMPCHDVERKDGAIHDVERVEYLRTHLEMCHRALAEGVDLRGYFAWSLMDNFEWGSGYGCRLGLYRVNFSTQERTLKLSGEYYRDVVEQNAVF